MVTKIVLVHVLNKEVFETIWERLNPSKAVKSTKNKYTFCYECEPVSEIILTETDTKNQIHSYIMQATLDCAKKDTDMDFYDWVNELYNEKFSVTDIEDFLPYNQSSCSYVEYEQIIPVENAAKTLEKLLKSDKWKPEQLDMSLWGNHKLKNGFALYAAKQDKNNFILRACCGVPFLKKKCGEAMMINTNGVNIAFILDPHTEKIIMHWGKTVIYETNRINRSPYTPGDMMGDVPVGDKAALEIFITAAEKYDLKPDLTYTPERRYWKCVYYFKKPKQKIFTVWTSPDEFRVKANLFKIDEYLSDCNITETVKNQLLSNTGECAHCENQHCDGVKVTLDGQVYYRCIYGAFTFNNLDVADFNTVIGLIYKEGEIARQKAEGEI